MIILDTTVLVYAVGGEHRLADPCRRLIEAVGSGRVDAITTPEAVQEFVHVRARRRSRSDAAKLGRAYADLLSPLLVIDGQLLSAGIRLFERSKKLGASDAVMAAAAMATDAEALVSADRSFDEVRSLIWWDPSGPEVAGLFN
ncbi:MAG: type II toxin-antitoxin system VapC family toxin [Actinomycetota bacterium]